MTCFLLRLLLAFLAGSLLAGRLLSVRLDDTFPVVLITGGFLA